MENYYSEAIEHYNRALAICKNDDDKKSDLLYRRGVSRFYDAQGDDKSVRIALDDLNKSISLKSHQDLYFCRGLIKYNLCDFKGAIKDCECSSNLLRTACAYWLSAKAKERLGQYNSALSDLDKAIHSNKFTYLDDKSQCYYDRGVIKLQKLGAIKAGICDLNKAIKICPKYWEAYYWLGIAKDFVANPRPLANTNSFQSKRASLNIIAEFENARYSEKFKSFIIYLMQNLISGSTVSVLLNVCLA